MRADYLKFLRKLIYFTLILGLAGFIIVYFLPDQYVSPTIPYQYLLFFSITIIIHYIIVKVLINKPKRFINYFMLITFGKLLFFLIIILVYIFLNREDAVQFVLPFLVLYLFFSGFEVVQSLKAASQNKQNKGA